MVDAELARPPQAEIQAYWWRNGNKVQFSVQVKNLSGVDLSITNHATVQAIVYEDAHVQLTNRFGRAVVSKNITLANQATGTYTLETTDLLNVNWDNLHFIALVDYRPGGEVGAYDMLQAAIALPIASPFNVLPESISFMVDPADVSVPPVSLNFLGDSSLSWTATPNPTWITITPASGSMSTKPQVSVNKGSLVNGMQQGKITFTTTNGLYTDEVTVKAYYGQVKKVFLPSISK